ncbi:hypothetical protein BOTBODRAFT_172254 [Botryobasidium botryosum FD-172 SS1]|uniref:U three protein 23 n=1 Tax=Botryobasidium botryosum (strain FD-172 SS1) TaxID=930990 RepID=A0A067MR45_BOTB1|nr:hypothetical protein BOTBODRAFT_172254 [Botryobasidium botryosum FD-172 SS1]
MRQKRAKAYKKLMNLYTLSFGFRQPYQVLIDATFCENGTQQKIEIERMLDIVLQGKGKPMITQCCMVELYKLGPMGQSTVDVAKGFERRKCNHREAIPGEECVLSVVGPTNKHRYVIATQSSELRTKLRDVPAVPVIHVNRSVMVLEPPSHTTLKAKADAEAQSLNPKAPEVASLKSASTQDATPPESKKRKGPKAPNPLSMKKKKPKVIESGTNVERSKKGSDESGDVGAKRTRVDEDGEGGRGVGEIIEGERSGRKRKRRRKGAQAGDDAGEDGGGVEQSPMASVNS